MQDLPRWVKLDLLSTSFLLTYLLKRVGYIKARKLESGGRKPIKDPTKTLSLLWDHTLKLGTIQQYSWPPKRSASALLITSISFWSCVSCTVRWHHCQRWALRQERCDLRWVEQSAVDKSIIHISSALWNPWHCLWKEALQDEVHEARASKCRGPAQSFPLTKPEANMQTPLRPHKILRILGGALQTGHSVCYLIRDSEGLASIPSANWSKWHKLDAKWPRTCAMSELLSSERSLEV